MMHAYAEVYLNDVVENQGKLFDYVAHEFPEKDTAHFIKSYMVSKTRRYIDEAQAYVNTMSAAELWENFCKHDNYKLEDGITLKGFLPDWIGEFYAYYQWYYDMPSREVIEKIPLEFLMKAYHGLHDLDLPLAVQKVGRA